MDSLPEFETLQRINASPSGGGGGDASIVETVRRYAQQHPPVRSEEETIMHVLLGDLTTTLTRAREAGSRYAVFEVRARGIYQPFIADCPAYARKLRVLLERKHYPLAPVDPRAPATITVDLQGAAQHDVSTGIETGLEQLEKEKEGKEEEEEEEEPTAQQDVVQLQHQQQQPQQRIVFGFPPAALQGIHTAFRHDRGRRALARLRQLAAPARQTAETVEAHIQKL